MKNGYKVMRGYVNSYPLSLLNIPMSLQLIADRMLPFSTGIEIECNMKDDLFTWEHEKFFKHIPDILEVNNDSFEQRYRIPKGIKGMICLYNICENLKQYSLLNEKSGIHYHIDFTNHFHKVNDRFIEANNDWILSSLKKWNYKGCFNSWECSTRKTAVKFHSFYNTIEFRIGEMTFDYEVMIKRIINCQNIVSKLRNQ